jgi:hypothetical protein
MTASWKRDVWQEIEAVAARGRLPICVFDLDSTLFSTAPRNHRILEEFVASRGAEHPDLAAAFAGMSEGDLGWNVHDDLARRGVRHAGLLSELKSFWRERFFTSEYLAYDRPLPGAAAFVLSAHARGALIYYLTGRHVGGMEEGTVRSLKRHGLPFWRGRCVVHLKPSFEMADSVFKTEAIADIRSYYGVVVATFENEPGNANLFLRSFPDARHFLLTTVHSPDAEEPRPELVRIPDFL